MALHHGPTPTEPTEQAPAARASELETSRDGNGRARLASQRFRRGLIIGAMGSLSLAVALYAVGAPDHLGLLHPGPMTVGHESLLCGDCHRPAPGTTRQQLQANVAHWLALRDQPAEFGFLPPASHDCLACHERPADRHPVNRFREPRFLEALDRIDARACSHCHEEHSGRRVSDRGDYCSACHGDLRLRDDPLDESHASLADREQWQTCLACHDFHGNHAREAPVRLADRIDAARIESYLADGPDPYAPRKTTPARERRP